MDSKSALKARLREAHKTWIDALKDRTGLSYAAMAKEIQAEPSSLSRFMKNDATGSTLDTLTIAALADRFAESPPPEVIGASALEERNRLGLREEAALYTAKQGSDVAAAIAALCGHRLHMVPWELKSRAIENEGYRQGDILIVDLNARPEAGDIVCAQIYNWADPAKTETIFRLYDAPYLITSGPREEHRKPELVDNQRVMIKGAVVSSFRPGRL